MYVCTYVIVIRRHATRLSGGGEKREGGKGRAWRPVIRRLLARDGTPSDAVDDGKSELLGQSDKISWYILYLEI